MTKWCVEGCVYVIFRQISPDGALLKTNSPNGVVLKQFTQGGCFSRTMHGLQSKPPLSMTSSL